jgi:hypothetical protein
VVGVQVYQTFEDEYGPWELVQLIQGHAEVQEKVGGVGRSGSGQFGQLDTFPDLTALAEGNGGVHRLETRRDPTDRKCFARDLDYAIGPNGAELLSEAVVEDRTGGGRPRIRGSGGRRVASKALHGRRK